MELQQRIAFEEAERRVGQKIRVLVDGYLPEDRVYACRSYMDAPEIDNSVIFTSNKTLQPGEFTDVLITDAFDYDITGKAVE